MNSKILTFLLLVSLLAGCATVPKKETLQAYRLHNTTYLSLVALCDVMNIDWEYDTFTRALKLSKDFHRINLMVGHDLVLVDGQAENLKYPIEILQGTVVVPVKFKEQILSKLFKGTTAVSAKAETVLRIKKVVIDAGHGGADPGAMSRTGLREKHINLDIAKRLAALLKSYGIEVVMTRLTDAAVSLERRVDIANRSEADLFISIHTNANRVRSLSGFEAYYISPYADDNQRAKIAAEYEVLNLNSSSFMQPVPLDLKTTLWDMIYTANRSESQKLCRSVCSVVDRNLNTKAQRIRGANFYVLKGTSIPAVLLEVGFLTNTEEERRIRNGDYRQQIAEAIAQGLKNYAQENKIMEASRQ